MYVLALATLRVPYRIDRPIKSEGAAKRGAGRKRPLLLVTPPEKIRRVVTPRQLDDGRMSHEVSPASTMLRSGTADSVATSGSGQASTSVPSSVRPP